MADHDVYQAVLDAAAAGRTVVLATVVATRGSVPRHAGSKMLIDPERGLIGTIGGGCGEADVLTAAREVAESGKPRLVRVELTDAIASWSPAVCGGIMDVFVEPVRPTSL
jgi:xanthine/CO dehydrogenase XdhC/CoxF family maturation factor